MTHETKKSDVEKTDAKGEPNTVKPEPVQGWQHRRHWDLDEGEEHVRYRKKWYQIWHPRHKPPPAPSSLDDASIIPLANASVISMLTYHWLSPIMTLGYQRTLQATDLWKMDPSRESSLLSGKFDESWAGRSKAAQEWNERLARGEISPPLKLRMQWAFSALWGGPSAEERKRNWQLKDGRKEASIAWALNDVLGREFWAGGIFKVIGDTSQLMGPLIVKALISFGQERAHAKAEGQPLPSIGRGIGLALGLFFLTIVTSLCQHQFFWRSMATGVLARTALIGSLYKRGLSLTPKERTLHPGAALVNHMSTDISRVDFAAQWFHAVWTAPIQVTVCLILLLVQMGPSALAGFALFVLIIPVQERAMAKQFTIRKGSMIWTDMRAKLLQELLGAMRIIKYFTYEIPYLGRIGSIRHDELRGIRKILIIRAANLAVAFSIPAMAAMLALITYALAGRDFNAATVFPSLALFNLLRQPLLFLPRALSATADAKNALARLQTTFQAELMEETGLPIDPSLKPALEAENATFQWEQTVEQAMEANSKNKKKGSGHGRLGTKSDKKKAEAGDTGAPTPARQTPFSVRDINMVIPRGKLYAMVGPVGSGKTSILSGLLGEMKITQGNVKFGGKVGYCSQIAWIQNATVRDNVLFGRDWDEERYWSAVRNASLMMDLELLPDGDLTEIGEKGINLSGGQKQRINIARALYSDADIVLMDDPLSAVDAHVGKALFENAILRLRQQGKSVLLVTHALHFVPQTDYIYTIESGRISEEGTYEDLINKEGPFSKLMKEFGGEGAEEGEDVQQAKYATMDADERAQEERDKAVEGGGKGRYKVSQAIGKAAGTGKLEGRLIQSEKRTVGSISTGVYRVYLAACLGWVTVPVVVVMAILMQGSQVLNNYTLVWWEQDDFHWKVGYYMLLYAMLGIVQAIFTFGLGGAMGWQSYLASKNLHHDSIVRVFHAPMAFFDTTPLGRIMGVFGKDVDTLDNQLADSMRMFVLSVANVLGAVIIITIFLYYFIAAAIVIAVGYSYFAAYYRESARELKRLDSSLRSLMYSHFAESLSGLATIRAYGETDRFIKDDQYFIDLENRALFLTITNQRWLSIRLDGMGAFMVFAVAIMCAVGINGVSPSQIGLILSYTTMLTQLFGMLTRQSAEVENNLNAVERITQYTKGDAIQQEATHESTNYKLPEKWPKSGTLDLDSVFMSYRPGLPPVLKGISMHIKDGEKIGVVGRTGAGKTSLITALYRLQELSSGTIKLDGVDASKLGLRDLRSKIAIIPQEPVLFQGTIRSNLDPFSEYEDVHLNDALRRAHLIDSDTSQKVVTDGDVEVLTAGTTPRNRFTLDSVVDAEGANFSVGERSLLSLARALVKDSKIICLDEATASVDLVTDNQIQYTIQTEFRDRTLLCIAHRLRTILSYDRICVMEAGTIAEFGPPEELYENPTGLFRGMCDRSSIYADDIRAAVKTRELMK
ncbi:ABC protein [Serendipita vermifera]|nr:ABC protein [Serendipita vermifera]